MASHLSMVTVTEKTQQQKQNLRIIAIIIYPNCDIHSVITEFSICMANRINKIANFAANVLGLLASKAIVDQGTKPSF